MIGDTVTLNFGTQADPENKTLVRVSTGTLQSEYRLREADRNHVLVIRHSTESNLTKGQRMDRHNVTYTAEIFPTVTYPSGQTLQAYAISRNPGTTLAVDTVPVQNVISNFLIDHGTDFAEFEN